MKRWRVLGLGLGLALVGCGEWNSQQLCKDGAAALCSKLFECFTTDAERKALGVGKSSAECTTRSQLECEARKLGDGGTTSNLCDGKLLYDASAAQQCTREVKALKCDAVRKGAYPSSCDNTCQ